MENRIQPEGRMNGDVSKSYRRLLVLGIALVFTLSGCTSQLAITVQKQLDGSQEKTKQKWGNIIIIDNIDMN